MLFRSDRGKEATVEMLDNFWTGWTKGWNLESEGGAGSAFERVVGGEIRCAGDFLDSADD